MNRLIITMAGAVLAAPAVHIKAQAGAFTRRDFTEAAESTVNGVVSVKSYATPQVRRQVASPQFFDDPFFEYFFGTPMTPQAPQQRRPEKPAQRQIGLGSGVIIDSNGYIVTNNHVINDAERLEVTLNDNRNYEATVVGADPVTDIALIKINATDLHSIPVGNSEDLRVGEWVLAVGNPFGFTSTVTAGIVSAKARNISTSTGTPGRGGIESYIQTDAAVNQGNSGGALVNLDGELVGINTAIYSRDGSYVGCSFAIPTSIVSKVIDDLRRYGTVQRAYLGLMFTELTPEIIAEKKIEGVSAGISVEKVEDRSAAREAGIKAGDIIIAIDNHPTLTTAQLQEALARMSPGDVVTITLVRDGQHLIKQATLRNRQGDTSVTRPGRISDLGCSFRELTEEECSKFELAKGVIVDDLGEGRFRNAGITSGTVIVSINGTPVTTPAEVEKIYNDIINNQADKVMFIKALNPAGRQLFVAVPLAD